MSLTVPNEAVATASSVSGNIHQLRRPSTAVLLLEPGRKPWVHALLFLAALPVVLGICIALRADTMLTVGLSLMSLLGALAMAIAGFCFHRFGTRVRFDCDRQSVNVTGARHGLGLQYGFPDIAAVQFCDAGIKEGDAAAWHAYQINLVIRTATAKLTRINLLESGGKSTLQAIAKEIAEFLRVPFYVGSHAASE